MKTILLLTDFSKRAAHAADYAWSIAEKTDAEILLYNAYYIPNVVPSEAGMYPYYDDVGSLEKASLDQLKNEAEQMLKNHPLSSGAQPAVHYLNGAGTVSGNIAALCKEKQIWMIAMGNKSDAGVFNRIFFGSETTGVIDKASRPVLLVPENQPIKAIKKIAFATDFSASEEKSIRFLVELGQLINADITLVHVFENQDESSKGLEYFSRLKAELNNIVMDYQPVQGAEISKALAEFATNTAIDVLAIAHQEHSFFENLFRRSTTKEMMNYRNIPLLVFPRNF